MNIQATLRGLLRRIAGAGASEKRRTLALPTILSPYGPRADLMPKPTPANLRKFAETPIARKAINTIKDRIAGMNWRVQPRKGRTPLSDAENRIAVLSQTLEAPNHDDSFRSFAEQVLEDVIVGGFGAAEIILTG